MNSAMQHIGKALKKGLEMGFLVLLVLLLVLVIGSKGSPQDTIRGLLRAKQAAQPSAPQTAGSDQPDQTGSWTVYADLHAGFSMKYPGDWYYEENPDFQQPALTPNVLETRVMFANFPPPFLGPAGSVREGCRLDVLVANTEGDPRQLLGSDSYKRIASLKSPASEVSVAFNGVKGIRRTYSPDEKAIRQVRTVVLLPGSSRLLRFTSGRIATS